MSLKQEAISGAKWTTVSTVSLALLGILKIAVLARYLAAEDFGLMALITFVLGFMSLFMDMGLTVAILHKQDISKKEYASLYWINIVFSLILFILISLSSPLIAGFYEEPDLIYYIPLASISIILAAVGQQFKTIKQKELDFRYIALTEIAAAVIGLIVGVYCGVTGYGVLALIFAALVQYTISNLIYLFNGIRSRGMLFHFKFEETREFLRVGIYQVGGQVVNYFNRDVDILLIGKFFGSEVLGGYSLAKQLVRKPSSIVNPIVTTVASPILSKIQDDADNLKNKFLYFLKIVSSINFLAYFFVGILAYPLVYIFYGAGFLHITIIVQILSFYMYLRAIGNPVGSLIVATGRTDIEFYWNLTVLAIMPVTVYIGAQFSIEGVAMGLNLVMLFLTILAWRFMIYPLCHATFKEYFYSIIPAWRKLYILAMQELKNWNNRNLAE